jgi:hypothetical protein
VIKEYWGINGMKIGDLYPVTGFYANGEPYVENFIVAGVHNLRIVTVRKDNYCCFCGKEIKRGDSSKFANISMKSPPGCPFFMVNFWWHIKCSCL